MEHPDQESLALLALGEPGVDAGHLAACDVCRSEVAALRRVAGIGAETQEVRDLPPPPGGVWGRIMADTTYPRAAPRVPAPAPVLRHRHPQRWVRPLVAACAALVVGIAGTLAVTRHRDRQVAAECGTVVVRANLSALPLAPPGATGVARVLCDGPERRLHLRVTGLPLQPGYYEVWLIDPDSQEMTPIGQLGDGGDVLLPLASTTDLRKYRLVDISAEQYDNNQAHSGESLLRGQLTT